MEKGDIRHPDGLVKGHLRLMTHAVIRQKALLPFAQKEDDPAATLRLRRKAKAHQLCLLKGRAEYGNPTSLDEAGPTTSGRCPRSRVVPDSTLAPWSPVPRSCSLHAIARAPHVFV